MPRVPYTRLTTAQLNTLNSATLGTLKPYQIKQITEVLDKINWKPKGSQSDVSGQPTLAQIVTALGANNP